jgi:hypothetical protein
MAYQSSTGRGCEATCLTAMLANARGHIVAMARRFR